MKLYSHINDIPVNNWQKIQEGFINENPDLSYLVVVPDNNATNKTKKRYEKAVTKIKKTPKRNAKLFEEYINYLYQMSEVDVNLNKIYTVLVLETLQYNVSIDKNKWRKLNKIKELKIGRYPVTKAFNEYLSELNKSYTDFEFEFHTIREDYQKEWKRTFKEDAPKKLIESINKGFGFFFIEEYQFEINSWVQNKEISVLAGMQMLTPRFLEIFIKSETKKIDDISEVNKRLEKDFKDNKQFDKWFAIRFDVFDMNKLNFRANKQSTILSEVISTSKILEQPIDTKTVTIGQLYGSYRESVKEVIEANKSKK